MLTYTAPHAARDALRWRHLTLELAQERATSLGLEGAAFPWRTIRGQECSGYWPAGTAAFHINADIADAVVRYQAASDDDEEFASGDGLELLVETARLWRSLGHHDAAGHFRIDGVTGPDEYSAIADNNVYTNLMAERNLREAFEAVKRHPQRAAELGVDDEEAAAWRDAAQAMLIPYDEELGVHPQAEAFTEHEIWDFDATAPEQYPLLLHFPYFDLYRKQVVKQADLVLALHLRGDVFSDEEKARDFAYYERLTVRDSSLSACTQAVDRRGGWPPRAGLRLPLRGRAHRSRRPPAQHARRAAHRVARGDMDRRRRGVWRDARPQRDPELHAPPAPGAHPAHVPPLLPWAKAAGGGRARAGDLLAAREAPRSRSSITARRRPSTRDGR